MSKIENPLKKKKLQLTTKEKEQRYQKPTKQRIQTYHSQFRHIKVSSEKHKKLLQQVATTNYEEEEESDFWSCQIMIFKISAF